MPSTEEIAGVVSEVTYDRLPDGVREATKRRLLDAIAVGVGNGRGEAVAAVKSGLLSNGSRGESRAWRSAGTSAPRAAMINAASVAAGNGPTFLSPTPAPVGGSIATVLAVAESRGAAGEAALAGIAAALELHGELAWHAPLDELHPSTHTAVAAAAGAGRVAGLDENGLTDALGTATSRVTLGIGDEAFAPIATGNAAAAAVYAVLLADGGVGAPDGFTAAKGWHDLLGAFEIDFDSGCERVLDAAVLPYESHPYGQAAIEAAITLASETALDPADIDAVTVETGEKATAEIDVELIAAALVDRSLSRYRGTRTELEPIAEATTVSEIDGSFARADIEAIPARVVVETHRGDVYEATVRQFEGHPAAPASWGSITEKFHALAGEVYDRDRREEIVETVRGFEAENPTELARLLT